MHPIIENTRIVEQSAIPQLLVLSQDTDDNSALKIIHALAAYWKFGYSVRYLGESVQAIDPDMYSHIVIHYRNRDIAYEEWCSVILKMRPVKRVLLLDNIPKQYGYAFQDAFGVSGIRKIVSNRKWLLRKSTDKDRILAGINGVISLKCSYDETFGAIDCITAERLLEAQNGSCLLSQMHANYCLSISVWQLGVPGFPKFFSIIRNFLFFADDRGHFSPYSYASLRIDDFPLTSEQYLEAGGVSDEERTAEVEALCALSEKFNARLEFMVSSKIADRNAVLHSIDTVVPKSFTRLKYYFDKGSINVNAHGRSHLDEERFRAAREVSPQEFSGLTCEETRKHLEDCISFIERFFRKKASGFVSPCWGYREYLTKNVCADYFSFIIDSSMNYRSGKDWPKNGFLDQKGMVHLIESWNVGSRDFDRTDQELWRTFMACGIPVHMMAHGLYLEDPVPSRKEARMLILASFAAFFPFLALWSPSEVLRLCSGLTSFRKWDRLRLLRKILVKLPGFRNTSVQNLLKVGQRCGVKWAFTEDMAEHLREYASLDVTGYNIDGSLHEIEFKVGVAAKGPFLFHAPLPLISAELDGLPLPVNTLHSTLEFACLARGLHTMIVRTQ